MSDGKLFGLVALMTGVIVALVVAAVHVTAFLPVHRSADLTPGQTWTVYNSEYSEFEIRSEYPVTVQDGSCRFPPAAEIRFRCPAADLQITDARPALLIWSHANHVTLTAR